MVHLLYAVCALVCALVTLILPGRLRRQLRNGQAVEKAYLELNRWVACFCMVDCLWGIAASDAVMNDKLLFIMSCGFHLCAAITPVIWLRFVFVYLGDDVLHETSKLVLTGLMGATLLAEIALLGINCFKPILFSVNASGEYTSERARYVLFYLQYAVYVGLAVFSGIQYFRERASGVTRHNYPAVFTFVAAPIALGIFQLIYPDAPAYSIGYTLGVCIIHTWILTALLQKQIKEKSLAEATSVAKTSFLFNMSHDIRTPMNAILGFTDIALRHKGDEERVDDCLDKIQRAGNHLLALINDILEISRIESGRLELSEAPADIREELERIDFMAKSLAIPRSIDYALEMNEIKSPFVLCDSLHLGEIITNLVSNAVKYTPEGGKVRLTVRQNEYTHEGRALFEIKVTDTGIGMSAEFQKRLFETFTREDNPEVARTEGSGIGLSIVKSLVDEMQGTISVQSKKGQGSTFSVCLPFSVVDEAAVRALRHTTQVSDDLNEYASLVDKKVLLVDDNALNREIAEEILTETGLIVELARDGQEALNLVTQKGTDFYDFILMDIQMPVMNGYEATRAIRSLPNGEKAVIIALSANAFQEDIQRSLAEGMNGHIAKPINVKTLLDTMKGIRQRLAGS